MGHFKCYKQSFETHFIEQKVKITLLSPHILRIFMVMFNLFRNMEIPYNALDL